MDGHFGSVAELADALDLGSSTVRCAGSIPVTPIDEAADCQGKF